MNAGPVAVRVWAGGLITVGSVVVVAGVVAGVDGCSVGVGAGVVIVTVGRDGLDALLDPQAATPPAVAIPTARAPIAPISFMSTGYSRPRTPSLRENARR